MLQRAVIRLRTIRSSCRLQLVRFSVGITSGEFSDNPNWVRSGTVSIAEAEHYRGNNYGKPMMDSLRREDARYLLRLGRTAPSAGIELVVWIRWPSGKLEKFTSLEAP